MLYDLKKFLVIPKFDSDLPILIATATPCQLQSTLKSKNILIES